MAFSHDGKYLCYTSGGSLFLKPLAETGNGLKITGPWDPRQPSFSSDGDWILFEDVSTSKLMKVPITGGSAQVILSIEGDLQGIYATDNEIVFCDNNAFYKVDLNGGGREKIYPRDTAAFATLVWKPQLLPDKKTILFHQFVDQSPVVKVVRLDESEAAKVIIDQSYAARYLDSGHIVYLKEESLQIVQYDVRSNRIVGPPLVITSGIGNFAINNQGTLVYEPFRRRIENSQKQLVWIDLEGNIENISKEPKVLLSPRISGDGQQIVVDLISGESFDIVIYNPVLGTATNFITKDSTISPTWAPDNNTIAYFRFGDPQGVFIKPVDNSYSPKLLFKTEEVAMLGNWSDDGRYLVFSTSGDIGYFDFADSTVTYLDYINAEDEFFPALSPDGKWLAYTSDRKTKDHVYVVPFPGPGRAHRVSVNEGFASVWAPDMNAIYFVGQDDKGTNVSRADIATSPQFSSSPPQVLFYGRHTTLYRFANSGQYQFGNSGLFDIHPDGRRFLMEQSISEEEPDDLQDWLKLQVIVNWPELLKGDN